MFLNCKELLRISWVSKGTNHTVIDEVKPESSLEALKMKVKFKDFKPVRRKKEFLKIRKSEDN